MCWVDGWVVRGAFFGSVNIHMCDPPWDFLRSCPPEPFGGMKTPQEKNWRRGIPGCPGMRERVKGPAREDTSLLEWRKLPMRDPLVLEGMNGKVPMAGPTSVRGGQVCTSPVRLLCCLESLLLAPNLETSETSEGEGRIDHHISLSSLKASDMQQAWAGKGKFSLWEKFRVWLLRSFIGLRW